MRPGQQNKRGRGRSNNNNNNNGNNNHRKGGNPLTRTYDSSGPDVKIRGTAQHIAEKYTALARDAQSSGDRVIAENYLQHAEHYNRIIAAAQAQMQDRVAREDRNDFSDRDGFDRDQEEGDLTPAVEESAAAAVTKPAKPVKPAPESTPETADIGGTGPQPVIEGTGPQPVIEGTPVEVSLEEEDAAAPRSQTPRRRSVTRPRRTRRSSEAQAAGEEERPATGGEASSLEVVTSE
ncbi:DUF4167 domain-containing protein [Shinella daejeonensis]|uniref:DUF4167 domain-containing protein n=1 Tax=Shinella daejeonensis TaxID=659017 RepID=UPI0020C7B9AC|nr:DUF4167 domain-containing protein [Shinella daejeonensis]MCP8897298.1 DUF4167 domain-containing protein [Shinella daejeonensis]